MAEKPKIAKSCRIDGEVAHVVRGVSADGAETTPEQRFARSFDFTGVSRAKLMEIAVDPLIIIEQRVWRGSSPAERKRTLQSEVKVTEMLSRKKVKKPPKDKALEEIRKRKDELTAEDKTELLELLES